MVNEGADTAIENEEARQWLSGLGFLLLPLLLALALYWPTVAQPYFWDDLPHFQWAIGRSWSQIWTSVIGLSYYRPLTFTVYKLLFGSLPAGVTMPSHLLLIFLHVASGCLVGVLTCRLLARKVGRLAAGDRLWGYKVEKAAGLIASLLFVSYPFAVLPISHFAALVHPLVTTLTLGAAVAAIEHARSGRGRWLTLAIASAFLAPYAHESGVMAGWIAILVLLFYDRSLARRNWRFLASLGIASSSFLFVWLAIPRSSGSIDWMGGQGLAASATFFLQAPTYPLQPLSRLLINFLASWGLPARWMIAGLPSWVLGSVWLVASTALLLAGWILRQRHLCAVLGIVLGWSTLAALPSAVALPFSYITVSQRLLYDAGPAAALLWATVAVAAAMLIRRPSAQVSILLFLVAMIFTPSVLYVRREEALHELALRPLSQLASIARRYPRGRHLVVNAVNWVNYKDAWYALGHEGIAVSADYMSFSQLVGLNSGNTVRFRAVTLAPVREAMKDHYYSTVAEDAPWDWAKLASKAPNFSHVWLTTYSDERITIEEAGWVREGTAAAPEAFLVSFDDKVFLEGADLQMANGEVTASLDWKVLVPEPDATILRHVYSCNGRLLVQGDGHPLERMLPFSQLRPGIELHDVRHIPLGTGLGTGCYVLAVGLYEPNGMRLQARAPDGHLFGDDVVLLPLTALGANP